MLVIDIIVEIVLNYYIRLSKAVIPLYNLYIEGLCAPCQDVRKHSMELLFLDIHLLADAEEDFDLVVQEVICVPCVLVAVVPELRELRDSVCAQPVVPRPARW
jgi:hypothetical protein